MKHSAKATLAALALLIAAPVISNAGEVNSRYDVTIGGFIKYDLGYSTQDSHSDPAVALRDSSSVRKNLYDEYGNTFMSSGETRLNFLIKGPDVWGAKTSGFVEGDFRGTTTGNAYGGFQLRHAWMKLNWPAAELTIGQTWQQFGMIYDRGALGDSDFYMDMKGVRSPQVALRYNFTKNLNMMLGIYSPTEWSGSTRQYNDDYARNGLPFGEYELEYKNENCGRIGPQMLRFAVGGIVGREKKTVANTTTKRYNDDTIPVWQTVFRYYVPFIPEKQGNKKGALALNGNAFIGQNFGGIKWLGDGSVGSYWRPGNTEAASPTSFGGFAQLTYYFANNVWANLMYGYLQYNTSDWARTTSTALGVDGFNKQNTYAVSVLYDASPNLRFGAQWLRNATRWNDAGAGSSSTTVGTTGSKLEATGTMDQYRVAAWYFF